MVMRSEKEMFLRIECATIPEKKKSAVGVRGMKLDANDVLKESYEITDTSENEQSYTFENLPKYDDKGNVINYLVDEREINEGELKFFS